jgi:DNA-binding winged helix-turn-helix (wHTH) protein
MEWQRFHPHILVIMSAPFKQGPGAAERTGANYRFGRCELDEDKRELHVDGIPVALEPRPFEVLLLLIRLRHRAVSTDELLDHVWRDRFVAPQSVATAIAKIRRATQEDRQHRWIATETGVGYRFVGKVEPSDSGGAKTAANALPGSESLRIALAPLDRLHGNPAADWRQIETLAQLGALLSDVPGLDVVPTAEVTAALRDAAGNPAASVLAMVQQRTGARHVVQTRLARDEGTRLHRLDYRLARAPTPFEEGTAEVYAKDLRSLACLFARSLVSLLSRRSNAPAGGDVWVGRVLDRAIDECHARRWRSALDMLTVVLGLDPENPRARAYETYAYANAIGEHRPFVLPRAPFAHTS